MEVKPGYKMTEVGVIPEEWAVCRLGEKTVRIGSGITPTGGNRVYKREGRPFLRSQNVDWGMLLLDDIAFIDEATHQSFDATEIAFGDVFLNITGASIGRSALADERVVGGNVNQHVCIIKPHPQSLDSKFLNDYLLSTAGQKQIDSFQAGGNRQGLNFGQIASFIMPLPSLVEQQAIAGALEDVDALIGSLDQLVAKKRDLKQAAMQQLLTGQTRLPGFNGGWREHPIGDQIDLLTGFPFPSDQYTASGVRLLRGSNVKRGETDWAPDLVQHWPRITPEISKYQLRAGDLVIAMDGSLVGRSYARLTNRDLPAVLLQRVARIRSSTLDLGYLAQWVGSERFIEYCDSVKTVTAIPHISSADIRNFPMPIPPRTEEQTAIAEVLTDMDAEIAALEKRRDKTRLLKQGIMQELLTGRTRLV